MYFYWLASCSPLCVSLSLHRAAGFSLIFIASTTETKDLCALQSDSRIFTYLLKFVQLVCRYYCITVVFAANCSWSGGTCRAAELHHTEMMMFIGVWSFFRLSEAELARRRITFLISETALAHRLSIQRSGSPLWGLVILLLLFQTAVMLSNKLKKN